VIQTVDVEIDENGEIRPVDSSATLPQGRAKLVWGDDADISCYLMSEASLADWLRPEEDEAWAYIQDQVARRMPPV
jgi:hypothetical protein